MERYVLKNREGEIISYIKAENIFEASKMFASIKKIDVKSLLDIFIIEMA
jgi:hypothetical protein